jgi:RNA polymerase sigma-70 factor (ECF subfamily)
MSGRQADAMVALATTRGRALTGYAYLLTGSVADAEDLVQEALLKVFLGRPGAGPVTEAYVRRAILNLYVDGYRRRRRWWAARPRLADADTVPAHDAAVAVRADVQAALAQLPRQQRACVVLRFYEDLTAEAIADRLGLATGTVKRYLSLATDRLEHLLGPVDPPAGAVDEDSLTVEIGDGHGH